MPRFDDRDRYGGTRLYVGHLSSRTRSRDLEDVFSRYGRVRDVDMKRDYAFVEFSDSRDADDARYNLDGRDVDGSRIIVEFAKGVPRGPGGSRDLGRGPPPGTGRCFNCGVEGHWARDCQAGDWKNKCYRCGERGHIEKNCHNSPKETRRGRSYSRSPAPRRGRSRSHSYSRGRSYSRSRSPVAVRRERSIEHERYERSRCSPERRSSKRNYISPSPSPSPSKGRKRTPVSTERSPEVRNSLSPREGKQANGYDSSPVGRSRSRSPANASKGNQDHSGDDMGPPENNGLSRSPSPYQRDDRSRSPIDYEDDKNINVSPKGSE